MLPVHLVTSTRTLRLRGDGEARDAGREITIHDDICPVCGERGGQLIIGAQTTSIAAHAVERLWSAPLNDHKKLILFSDSVQDAAHRALLERLRHTLVDELDAFDFVAVDDTDHVWRARWR